MAGRVMPEMTRARLEMMVRIFVLRLHDLRVWQISALNLPVRSRRMLNTSPLRSSVASLRSVSSLTRKNEQVRSLLVSLDIVP